MTHDDEFADLVAARERLAASDYTDRRAHDAVLQAERRLAAARGEPWAERLSLGVAWDIGAPLPHVISNGTRTDLICHAADSDPGWDGTDVTVVSPTDEYAAPLLRLTFDSCQSIKFGGPNDEVLNGHPLFGRGLEAYQAHVVRNSPWIAEQEAINSVHALHRADSFRTLTHYLLVFHDDVFEALARGLEVRTGRGTLTQWLHDAASSVIASPS